MRYSPPRSLAFSLSAVLAVGMLSAWSPPGAAAADPEKSVIVLLDGSATPSLLKTRGPQKFHKLINAVSMKVPASQVAQLSQMPGVRGVFPDTPVRMHTDVSVPLIGSHDVWKRQDGNGVSVRGTGVTVAVIDSGVDYTHPDLGGGLGEGFKVVGGYDFVNDDADPMDDNGHGTHVAGIIAGKAASADGITGVAPDAQILAYKAMDEWGSGDTSDIIAAIEAAIDPANPHRADVINMSLGGYADGVDPLGLAATAATKAGVVVVASAGNDGPSRDSVGSPAAADGVIAVGASTSNLIVPETYLAGQKDKLQTYRGVLSANAPLSAVTAPVVDAGSGSPEELDQAGDLHGKIVRVNAHIAPTMQTLWQESVDLAKDVERRGAIALIGGQSGFGGPVLASQPGVAAVAASGNLRLAESGDLYRMDKLVVIGMDSTQFAELTPLFEAGPVSMTIKGIDATDQIASFSSRGPSLRFGLKPDLVAPGVNIRSTIPKALFGPGQYLLSGTSMAAPHVAGAAALLRQLRPDQDPAEVKAALVGTSKRLSGSDPTTQGAGRLDIPAAANATLTASPSTLSFGLADLGSSKVGGSTRVTLRNSGNRASVTTFQASHDITVMPPVVVIPAGRTATVTVTLRTTRPEKDTEVTGWITAKNRNGSKVNIPYLLVVRPLIVQASPDPSDGHSTVWVGAPAPFATAPVITIKPPHGRSYTVTPVQRGETVYTVDLAEDAPGVYEIAVSGEVVTGQRLIGDSAFEVTPEDSRRKKWEPIGPNSAGGYLSLSASAGDQAVMVTDYKAGPWLTTDHGASWKQLNRLPIAGANGIGSVIVDAANAERWWYQVNEPGMGSKILRTDDRGKTWRTLTVPASYITKLIADEKTRVLVAQTGDGLLISTDGGESWTAQTLTVPAYDIAIGGDDLYLATGRTGIYKMADVTSGAPGTAVQIYAPTNRRVIVSIAADSGVVAGLSTGLGLIGSHDGGKTWTVLKAQSFGLSGLTASGGSLFVANFQGKAFVGADHGRVWTETDLPSQAAAVYDYDKWADGTSTIANTAGLYTSAETGYKRLGVQAATIYDLVVCGNELLAGTDNGVYRTTIPASSPEWGAADGEGWVGAAADLLAVSPVDSNVVWKVRKFAFGGFEMTRSTDAGKTWQDMGSGMEVPTSILIHPADPNRVYIGFQSLEGSGVLATTNGGQTWKNLFLGMRINAMAGDPQNPKRLWLGTYSGLYRSDDGGITTTKVTDGVALTLDFAGRSMIVGGEGIKVSQDGGRTFRTANTGSLQMAVEDFVRVGHTIYAAANKFYADGLAKGGRGVLRSTDGGMTWHNVSSGLQNSDATSLAVSPDGKWLFVGTYTGGVHRMAL